MLGKLLKYEFKATGRVLVPIYILMLLAALVGGFTFGPNAGTFSMIIIMIFAGLATASIVLTIIITVQRFNNNLLTDEGYLMFTLPVSTTKLILSKLIVAFCWCLIGTIAGILCGIAMGSQAIPWSEVGFFFKELTRLFSMITWKDWVLVIEFIVGSMVSYIIFVLVIYASLSVSQLPFACKHRKIASLGTFFIIYIIYSSMSGIIGNVFDPLTINSMELFMGIAVGLEILVAVGLFFATRFILDRHLNLE
ncbi:MAG: hypothetical protein RSC20_00065 [Clostridiales bacterium]